MGWLTSLFGSSDAAGKAIETAADGIYHGLDKLIYTEEEKADALFKGRELFMDFAKIAYDQNSIRSVTRRWLAFMVMCPTMLCFLITLVGQMLGQEFATASMSLFTVMIPWAGGVLAFYFGSHLIGSIKK